MSSISSFFESSYYSLVGGFRMNKNTALSSDQQRKLLLGAVYAAQQGFFLNAITTGTGQSGRRRLLRLLWRVDNREEAKEVLDYLKNAGDRRFFNIIAEALCTRGREEVEQLIEQRIPNPEERRKCMMQYQFASVSIRALIYEKILQDPDDYIKIGPDAWDAGRLVFWARVCYEQEFITETEMWNYIDAADEIAHSSLTSWEEYGRSYMIGRTLWCGTANYTSTVAGYAKKLMNKPNSPWKLFPFEK